MKIYDALNGQMRLVGGCVRDFLLGKKPTDIDISTPFVPDIVKHKLEKSGIRVCPVAPRYGVMSATICGEYFEITTLRRETYDTGKEVVTFITDYAEDARRRDFTINALSMDRDNVYDYFDGQTDLKNKRICFIGEPIVRLKEDALRILRYLRFWSVYGDDEPDPDILALFSTFRGGLEKISYGRRKKEFNKILMSSRVIPVLDLMEQNGLLPYVTADGDISRLKSFLIDHPTASLSERLLHFGHYLQTERKKR